MASSSRNKQTKQASILMFMPKRTAEVAEIAASNNNPPSGTSTSQPSKRQRGLSESESEDAASDKNESSPSQQTNKQDVEPPPAQKPKFQLGWFGDYTWLRYDKEENTMTCALCIKHGKKNAMTDNKCRNFKTTSLDRHPETADHRASVLAEKMQGQLKKSVDKLVSEKESAVIVGLKAAFWIAQEGLAISKYGSLMEFLEEVNCPHVKELKCSKSVTYGSDKTAAEMMSTLATVIRRRVDNELMASPYVSFLLDESTDIATSKKLVVYARVLDTKTFTPSTHFVKNMKVESATGEAIYNELKSVMNEPGRVIPPSKVMGLGTDGAKVMTGTGKGLTGYMLRDNPMLLNYHCIAHRLALVTSQAASSVTYLVDYQTTLTGIFYFFKASANRVSKLSAVQDMLNEPSLKVKEVHEVRWLSTYIAVQTVYRTLDSLLTFFSTDSDAKSKGYGKKMSQYDFVASTYLMMDVLPIVSEMCLVFQKKDLDISQVKVQVEHTKRELEKLKAGEAEHTYLYELKEKHLSVERNKVVFKQNHILQGKQNIESIKKQFIDQILQKLDERFPDDDSNVIYAFSILVMRPLSFLSKAEVETWGNEKLEVLIRQYGETKVSTPTSEQPKVTCEPLINADDTRKEWTMVKNLVLHEGYPRDRMTVLWSLINQHHKQEYPNLLTLAALALLAPIHTADCERGFSAQNATRTALRNRLSAEKVDEIMTIRLEGGDRKEFDFLEALHEWRAKKRKLFA